MKTLGQIAFEIAHPEWMDFAIWEDPRDVEVDRWEAAAQAVRQVTIEECAKECEDVSNFSDADVYERAAAAIRALKDRK